jgi:hypothetical protein
MVSVCCAVSWVSWVSWGRLLGFHRLQEVRVDAAVRAMADGPGIGSACWLSAR